MSFTGRAYDNDHDTSWYSTNKLADATGKAYDDGVSNNDSLKFAQSKPTKSRPFAVKPNRRKPKRISNQNESIVSHQKRESKRSHTQRPEMHDLEQRMAYKQRLQSQSKEHLRSALQTAYQTEEIAADTSQQLYCQRKQLENVDKMLHETNDNLNQTEHTLKGMQSIWGGIANYFRKAPKSKPYDKKECDSKMNIQNQMIRMDMQKQKRIEVSVKEANSNQTQFDDGLDELHQSVLRMKVMAENMNQELVEQNDLLNHIDDKMDTVNHKLRHQTRKMDHIR